jgi:hypothetical protein
MRLVRPWVVGASEAEDFVLEKWAEFNDLVLEFPPAWNVSRDDSTGRTRGPEV